MSFKTWLVEQKKTNPEITPDDYVSLHFGERAFNAAIKIATDRVNKRWAAAALHTATTYNTFKRKHHDNPEHR